MEGRDVMITIDDVMKLDLRIAEVVAAESHPNADRLIVLQIDLGEERRQIVAGIKKQYTPEELVGKKIVVIANLQPAILRGVESNGMLLAASTDEALSLIVPERIIAAGAKVK